MSEINNTQVDDAEDIDVYVWFNKIWWCLFENIRKFMATLKRKWSDGSDGQE